MTRDEIIAEMTILIDRAYEAGYDNGYEAGREWLGDPEPEEV